MNWFGADELCSLEAPANLNMVLIPPLVLTDKHGKLQLAFIPLLSYK